jgi:hypothetical protein
MPQNKMIRNRFDQFTAKLQYWNSAQQLSKHRRMGEELLLFVSLDKRYTSSASNLEIKKEGLPPLFYFYLIVFIILLNCHPHLMYKSFC